MEERRKAERYLKEVPVTFSSGKVQYKGIAACFSEIGLFIITDPPFKPGTHLTMVLKVSSHETIHLSGVVIRTIKTGDTVLKDGMGIKLDETPFIYHNYINKLRKV